MNSILRNIFCFLVMRIVSIIVTYWIFNYLQSAKSASTISRGNKEGTQFERSSTGSDVFVKINQKADVSHFEWQCLPIPIIFNRIGSWRLSILVLESSITMLNRTVLRLVILLAKMSLKELIWRHSHQLKHTARSKYANKIFKQKVLTVKMFFTYFLSNFK